MTTIPQERAIRHGRRRTDFVIPELWASVAIIAMWLAVLFTAVWGPDFVSTTPGGTTTTIPSAVLVALFASLATWAVAKYGFRRPQ